MTRPAPTRLLLGGAELEEDRMSAELLAELPSNAAPSEESVRRVWLDVSAPELRRRSLRPLGLAFLVAGAALFIALVMLRYGPKPGPSEYVLAAAAEVLASSGGVFHTSVAKEWDETSGVRPLSTGEGVRTDLTGRALLRIGEVAALWLPTRSAVQIDRLMRGKELTLSHGIVTARVSKRPAQEPFLLNVGPYTVRVVGTVFTAELELDGNIAVSVREGVVDVLRDQRTLARVTAGHRWTSDPSVVPGPDRTSDDIATVLEDGLRGVKTEQLSAHFEAASLTTSSWVPPTRTHPADVAAEPAAPAVVSTPQPLRALAERPTTPSHEQLAPLAGSPPVAAPAQPLVLTLPTTPPVVAAPQVAAPVAPPVAVAPAPAKVSGAIARAQDLEKKGQLADAAKAFEMVPLTDRDAELALHEAAAIYLNRLGDLGRAFAALKRFRTLYPASPNIEDADEKILYILEKQSRTAEAEQEATHLLTVYSQSPRADEVRFARGNLRLTLRNYAGAIADYKLVTDPVRADEAAYAIISCHEKLGEDATVRALLRDYLRRFPKGIHRPDVSRALGDE